MTEILVDLKQSENMMHLEVTIYVILFIVGAAGNYHVLHKIYFGKKSRINIFIVNLAVADLIVVLLVIPFETAWVITYYWKSNEFACRALHFVKNFGFYYSSMVLVCISIDRYMATVEPLRLLAFRTPKKRNIYFILTSIILSTLLASPQVSFS